MHDVFTTLTRANNDLYSSSSEDLLSPISITTRRSQENWHIPESIISHPSKTRRGNSKAIQKTHFTMPSRTASSESNSPVEPPSVHSTGGAPNNSRWRFNGTGQLVDSEAIPEWDLADEIANLKIGGVNGDGLGQMRTPPKSKTSAATVNLADASPLESTSDASANSSPPPSEHQSGVAHSRGSSADTSSSNRESILSATAQAQLGLSSGNETKERPHSFSGGLSAAELRRLQQAGDSSIGVMHPGEPTAQYQQWSSAHFRDTIGPNDKQFPPDQQPTYPSLTNTTVFPRSQQYDRSTQSPASGGPQGHAIHPEELLVDYHNQQRNFSPLSQQAHGGMGPGVPQFAGRPNPLNGGYRQPPRGFTPQGVMPSPTSLGYPGGHHTPHLSLGNAQQLYDMMHPSLHPDNQHPAVARVLQQHNVYRPSHQHSASDPSALRDAATLALLNSNMQAFGLPAQGIYPQGMAPASQAMPIYPGQFYGTQEAYPRDPRAELAAAQAMANQLQPQYTGYGSDDMSGGPNGNGPSANNRKLGLYKTELCRSWEEKGTCRYGAKCQFAHGEDELRKVARHPKYKTEICRTFWVSGSCPYGKRCCFIHTELPASGAPPGADGAPPPTLPDTRARSLSTNSDPNEQSVSLLARISAKRKEEASHNGSPTPLDSSPPSSGFQFSRPPTGSLRVDTSVLDGSAKQQNKSAYPSFASNVMLPSNDQASAKSPVPVTAGPDLGRHNNSRLEIVGYNQQRLNKPSNTNPNVRHSFNGTEVNLEELSAITPNQSTPFRMASPDRTSNGVTPRVNGHSRSGSAGTNNWGSFSRSSLGGPSQYPQSSGAGGELKGNSPWSTSELAVGSSRLNEKAWV